MTDILKRIYKNQGVRYVFFGGCTTMVNLVSYWFLRTVLAMDLTRANFIAVVLAILFAYLVNKLFVFESKQNSFLDLIREAGRFFGLRLVTMFIEVFGMVLMCSVWTVPDMYAKLVLQVVVLVLNFVFSKIFVFGKEKECRNQECDWRCRLRKKRCLQLSFGIPAVTMLIAYIVNGVYPFGDRGVLIIDSLHQYLPFFTDFHQKLANSESLLYSFGGGLGYNMWATFAYYLASPLNLLMAAVPMEHVMDFMAYLILLKISLAGLFFGWYLTERNKGTDYMPVPFACMFALSTFIIGYYFNIMWLDSVMILPLVMKGIENIVEKKSGKLFCGALFYGLYCNYYIGFMLCLFSCLYFLVLWIGAKKFVLGDFIKSGLRFTWFALLAGGMAAIVLVPAYMALGITESADNSFPAQIKFYTDWITQWTGHFALVEPINIYDDQSGVNIYCGVAVMILGILYILNKELRFTERASRVLLLGLFLVSMNFNMLNYIWHGFHIQNGLPNRFAFLYIALLLIMGFDALRDIRKLQVWRILIAWLVPVAFTAFCMYVESGERPWYVYVTTLALLAMYGILLLVLRAGKKRLYIVKNILLTVLSLEMVATGIYGVCLNGTVSRSSYVDEQIAFQKLMPRQEGYGEFFRSEIDSQRMRNENMFMGANGVVLFSSTMPEATVNLCRSIGMEARTNKSGFNGMTKLFTDVFGVRYLVAKNGSDSLYQMQKVDEEEPLTLYRNPNALSVGFMVSDNIREWDITNKTPMRVQDDFVTLATGIPFFYTLREAYSLEEGPSYIIRLHPGEQTYIEFTDHVKKVTIKTPQYEKNVSNYNANLFNLGSVTEKSKANIMITYKDNKEAPVPVRVYTCTDEEYRQVYEKLSQSQLENVTESGNKLSGTINVKEAGTLLLTIPYDNGWKVLVDGTETETYRVGEALTGVHLTPGEHQVSMTFTPDGLWIGSILSIICLVLFLLSCFIEKQYARRNQEETI